jgi:hypothetical protein
MVNQVVELTVYSTELTILLNMINQMSHVLKKWACEYGSRSAAVTFDTVSYCSKSHSLILNRTTMINLIPLNFNN